MTAETDRKLIDRALQGNALSFRHLVERHQSFVYSLAFRLVGNRDDAKDITQEAFIRLWRNLNRYNPDNKLTTWLYRIVTNLSLDMLKSARNKYSIRNPEAHDDVPVRHTADQYLIETELRTVVSMMASLLTPKQKAVFVLRDLEELTVDEVSEILSMSPGKIKSNLFLARKRMSELIKSYYEIKKPVTDEVQKR